jgi:4-diphosphocytidyl-2-C-methyl-D-erythritol kinase
MSATRRARVRALAKINLGLRVIAKRPDGYHELRTVFQTISLADRIDIAFTPGRKTEIALEDGLGIPDNLVSRAAAAAMDAMRATGRVEMRLVKRIPMGAGLGGGSSDAAAVLLALPALAGNALAMKERHEIARQLGSDVPFFLLGGTAVGIGRGTELFPLADAVSLPCLVVAPGIHVDTPAAYAALSPGLTSESEQNKIFSFQSYAWSPGAEALPRNDFEPVVFGRHSRLATLKKKLAGAGASVAMMTGSGSALFGLFRNPGEVEHALRALSEAPGLRREEKVFRVSLVSRARYRSMWRRMLAEHTTPELWPPQSRYTQ